MDMKLTQISLELRAVNKENSRLKEQTTNYEALGDSGNSGQRIKEKTRDAGKNSIGVMLDKQEHIGRGQKNIMSLEDTVFEVNLWLSRTRESASRMGDKTCIVFGDVTDVISIMTAVVRIKRNCTEDPLDAVLINCKKRKVDSADENEEVSAVLSLAGTLTDTKEDILKHLKKQTKAEVEEQYKKHSVDIIDKLRVEKQISIKNSRYKVVSSHRFPNEDGDKEKDDLNCTIYDVELNDKPEGEDNTTHNYVYDLYYTNSDLSEFMSVYPLSEGLVYGAARDNGHCYTESEDSEDSNAENHWKNDYPDEESDMDNSKCSEDAQDYEDDSDYINILSSIRVGKRENGPGGHCEEYDSDESWST
ncbi:hypothetical protein FQA39_LY08166 [Lamprigera yunnana]|nr:hypothetical protein FQA39_LY08166 [Lamprigera yunnana]